MDSFVIRKGGKKKKKKQEIKVYTDGACSNNGKPDARAGYGVWFGEDDPRNASEPFDGLQTNNRAELLAIVKALSILREDIENGVPVRIFSDSSYSIRCCTTYGAKCEKKNWTGKKPIPKPPKIFGSSLLASCAPFDLKVPFPTPNVTCAGMGRSALLFKVRFKAFNTSLRLFESNRCGMAVRISSCQF